MLWGACVRHIGWWNRSWGLFVPGFVGGFRTDWVGSWSGDRWSIINDINVFWWTIGDKSQGLWITSLWLTQTVASWNAETCVANAVMLWWCYDVLLFCRAWSMFVILNWNQGLLVWAWCLVRHAYTNICTLDFAWLNLRLLTGSSANWRRLPFAQRQRTFYPLCYSVSILWVVRPHI